jgi:hypothetical protein
MNLQELNKIKIVVTAQPVQDEPKRFKVTDFPSIKDISYTEQTIQPTDEYAQARTVEVWSFILRGKWQPDTPNECESDEQALTVSGICRKGDNPENHWSIVALAVQAGNGLVMVKPNAVFFQKVQQAESPDHDAQPDEWEKVVKAYSNDILPVTKE